MSIVKQPPDGYGHEQSVELLTTNDIALELETQVNEFLWNELLAIYADSGLSRKYKKASLNTWENFVHFKALAGYSIWKYPISDIEYNILNMLYMDSERLLENRGQATSESLSAFDRVLLYNGDATPVYNDYTTEAGTEQGTPFLLMDSINDYLYIGADEKFNSLALAFSVFGSGHALKVEYYAETGTPTWQDLTVVDDTEDFSSDGRISFTLPSDWTKCAVNEHNHYWIRISTTSVPTIVAQAYSILPGDSVPTLLAMSRQQIQDKEWCWCYFNEYVYMTIKNEGGGYYEGIDFIKDSSSDVNKENYFESNHHYKTIYEDENYTASAWAPDNLIITKGTSFPDSPGIGQVFYRTDQDKWYIYKGYATPIWEEIRGIHKGTSFPASPSIGQLFYRTDENKLYWYKDAATPTWEEIGIGGGASTFLGLTDTPADYTGAAKKITVVNEAGDAIVFASDLYWDEINDRVGIGTPTPDSLLHIKGNIPGTVGSHPAGQLIIQDPDDTVFGNAVITGYESDGAGNPDQQLWYLGSSSGSNSDIILLNRRNSKLQLGTNGVVKMTISGDGKIGIGLIPTANMMGLSIEEGLLTLKERTTPTADTNYAKIYSKSDNKLYFQDGAGVEHELGAGGAHALGGAEHNPDTLANLNTKVSNGTLDKTTDPRDPNAHKSSHQNGGGDEVNVGGLSGELADNQPPKTHKTSHQNGGGDEISVAGLSGELADAQPPKAHNLGSAQHGADTLANLNAKISDANLDNERTLTFFIPTADITVGANKSYEIPVPFNAGLTILKVYIHCKQGPGEGEATPTDYTVTVDVNKNGTTIFTTQGNRPSIVGTTKSDESGTPDVTALAKNDIVSVDVDVATAEHSATDMTIEVRCKIA